MNAAPDADTLRKFALGDLPPQEWDRVARYLEANPQSPDTIAELGTEDTFLSALRAVPAGPADDPPEVRSIIAAAVKLLDGGTAALDPGTGSLPFVAASEAEIVLPPNGRLGRFRIVRELGRGGMGAVFAAVDEQLGRDVALKVMLPRLAANPIARERFLREARTAARVEHDNIVPILEVGEDAGIPFIAMPLLRGESLDDRLKAGAVPAAEAVRIARAVVEGLAAAHAHGLIHRDIKPSNVWLETNPDGRLRRVRILDFGLARLVTESDRVTLSGTILGTPAFMAPEQARGSVTIDARADLFSLGGVLYRMTTGRNPFHGTDTYSLLSSLATDTPKAPTELNASVPRAMNDLILKLLQKDPAARPQSAADVLTALDAIPTTEPAPVPRRSRALPIAAVALSLIGLVGVLFGGTIIRIATNKGELVVEVNDANVEVVVKQDGAVVVDKTKDRRFVLTAKDGEIEFLDPETGATAQTKTFRLTRGGTDRVVATMGPAAAVKANEQPNGKPIPVQTTFDDEQKAVEWVIKSGGQIDVWGGGPTRQVRIGERLPLQLCSIAILFDGQKNVDDSNIANLRALSSNLNVCTLRFRNTGIKDAGLAILTSFGGFKNVHTLMLDGIGITDRGLTELKKFPSLSNLQMSGVAITNAGMSELGRLKLDWLMIGSCQAISDTGIEQLSECVSLTRLDVGRTQVTKTGAERLAAKLPKCEIGYPGGKIVPKASGTADRHAAQFALKAGGKVRVNGETLDIADAKDLPTKAFTLTACNLSYRATLDEAGLAVFAGCKNLKELDFRATKVTAAGLAHFANCKELTDLALEGPAIDDAAAVHFRNCRKITKLFLSHASMTDAGLAHFANCAGLTALNLDHAAAIGDEGFLRLKAGQLTEVHLSGTRITDHALASFEGSRALHTLHLADTKVTDAGLAKLKNCPSLATLNLSKLPITDDGLAQLAGTKFTALNLGYSKITDAGLAHLKASTGLIQLELGATAITDKGVSALRDLKALKVLELSGCAAVTGATLKDLDLRELESFSVARTGFTDDGLATLAMCPKLRMLHCEESKVTRAGVYKLRDQLPKCRIVWTGGTIEPK